MVTIHRKEHLAASCVVLLAYSFFSLLHVASGSYDYDASGIVESRPANLHEIYDRSSNHEDGYSMRMSRSTEKKEPSKEKEEKLELGRKKREERSFLLETVDNVAGLLVKETAKAAQAARENIDAISQRMVKDESIKDNVNSAVETKILGSNNKKDPKDPKEQKTLIDENDEPALRNIIKAPQRPSFDNEEDSPSLRNIIKAPQRPSFDVEEDSPSLRNIIKAPQRPSFNNEEDSPSLRNIIKAPQRPSFDNEEDNPSLRNIIKAPQRPSFDVEEDSPSLRNIIKAPQRPSFDNEEDSPSLRNIIKAPQRPSFDIEEDSPSLRNIIKAPQRPSFDIEEDSPSLRNIIKAPQRPSFDNEEDNPSLRLSSSVKFAPTDILKEILKLKEQLHLPNGKKDEKKDSESGSWKNAEDNENTDEGGIDDDYDYNNDEDDDDSDEDDEDYDDRHKGKNAIEPSIVDKKDPIGTKDSQGLDSFDRETLNGTLSLYKLITDVFLPKKANCTDDRPHPWRALTSSQYAKQVSKGKGPNSSRTTKETKSKLSLIIGRDPVIERVPEKIFIQTIDQPKIEAAKIEAPKRQDSRPLQIEAPKSQDVKIQTTKIPDATIADESIPETTSSNVPNESEISATSVKPPQVPELEIMGQAVKQPTDENLDAAYRILDSAVLILTKSQDTRDQPNSNWWY